MRSGRIDASADHGSFGRGYATRWCQLLRHPTELDLHRDGIHRRTGEETLGR
jgi:hypothetical protein